jgi:plastocyanin
MKVGTLAMLAALAAIVCGGGGALYGDDDPPAGGAAAVKAAPQDGFSVTGTVKIKGDIPKRRKVRMDADPKCAALHAEPPLNDEVVADADGNVQWAFVYVKAGAEGKKGPPPAPAVIDQKGCTYHPHVLGIVAGQEILIKNSDELLHNIHALPFNNKEFNEGQPQKGMEMKKTFANPEIMVKVKCDVHPWMGAWVGVLEHSFFAVTNEKGAFEIKGLPAGRYTIEAWHEKYKSVTKEIEVKAAAKADFELTEKKE